MDSRFDVGNHPLSESAEEIYMFRPSISRCCKTKRHTDRREGLVVVCRF